MSGSSYGHEDSELPEVPTEVPFDDEVDCASEVGDRALVVPTVSRPQRRQRR